LNAVGKRLDPAELREFGGPDRRARLDEELLGDGFSGGARRTVPGTIEDSPFELTVPVTLDLRG